MTFIQPLTTASFVVNDQFEVTKVTCPGSFEFWENNPHGQLTRRAELREGDVIVSFDGCDLNKISQLDPLLTDLAQSNGYYEFILHRPNETARNGRRYDRLHLRCKKQAEFKPGSKWGGKDGSVASDAGGDVQPGKRNTRKRGSQVCDMSICNSRVSFIDLIFQDTGKVQNKRHIDENSSNPIPAVLPPVDDAPPPVQSSQRRVRIVAGGRPGTSHSGKGTIQVPSQVAPSIMKGGSPRFYSGKDGHLRCIATRKLKSQCFHCNALYYTGPDGHKYCRDTKRRKAICKCDVCTTAGVNKGLCAHLKQKHKCKECSGVSLCHHNRQKSKCKECFDERVPVAGICKHRKEKYRCSKCNRKR
jgi:hypothetical protein